MILKGVATFLALIHLVASNLDLVILHNNDLHGRFEETERNSGTCQPDHKNKSCIGGFARTAHVIRKFRKDAADGVGPDVLFLNAGDNFIGTVWYTIHTWNITAALMNALRPEVQSLGNHEFDKGTDEIEKYVSAINFPIIGGNVDFSKVPALIPKIPKSVILEVKGVKIGVVGHVTTETEKISHPGDTIFLDELETVKAETERLDSLGIKIIIVLGHSGYMKDQEIAEKVPLADVVVGGHTNTFLWNGPQPDNEAVEDPYPKVITQPSGKKVPVVQAYAYTKYLGILNVKFDNHGDLISFHGQPMLLDSTVPQEEDILQLLNDFRPLVDGINSEVVGNLLVYLDGDHCRTAECNYGNLIADANVLYRASVSPVQWTDAPIGLMNGGSIRASVKPGAGRTVIRGDLLATLPWENQIVSLKLNGSDIIKTLEIGVRSNGETSLGEFLQVSGLKVIYDMSKPPMSRVVSVKVRCGDCDIPIYANIDLNKNYTIVTTDFLADGFDGHYILKENGFDKKFVDLGDLDILVWYFQSYTPVFAQIEGRITFIDSGQKSSSQVIEPVVLLNLLFVIMHLILDNVNV